ncbi:MAG TPA: transketolase [bacterium]
MRNALCETLVKHSTHPQFVFLTGDLGYMALEPLQKSAGDRFINAGLAEQNMVSVAAGLAKMGFRPWAYSIAPFLYARPLEQIRNDICLHDLPVKLVGNGGGYAYGVMGATHHAIEDYGILLSLLNMHVFVPAFKEDVVKIIEKLTTFDHPAYLRLGRDEKPAELKVKTYAPWRKIVRGKGPTLLVVGPLAGGIIGAVMKLKESKRPNLWVLTELPIEPKKIPSAFLTDLKKSNRLTVVEEHVAHGGAGEMICRLLLLMGKMPRRFTHHCAQGYPSGYYGSQNFHRKESGLAPENIIKELTR